ncbi:hypothetical protein PVAND_002482 [Polypedilum vanderplanki]|uniref:F-box domain-containing protein n=1 Tax=Polypedilum vanderplanki TaxID=319348 RepID=A0A9J6BRT1_POLVA|nr:hypothetical protein PVAND_002482 [Polypedilum vanderplanki]
MDKPTLLDLPTNIIEEIMSYLSYEEIANSRIVCRRFNKINQQILNRGFFNTSKGVKKLMLKIKLTESALDKLNYFLAFVPLALYHTNFDSLYKFHIQNGTICFYPGKLLDAFNRYIRYLMAAEETGIENYAESESLTKLFNLTILGLKHFQYEILPDLYKKKELKNKEEKILELEKLCEIKDAQIKNLSKQNEKLREYIKKNKRGKQESKVITIRL